MDVYGNMRLYLYYNRVLLYSLVFVIVYNSLVIIDKKEISLRLDKYIIFIRGRLIMLFNDYWEYVFG